jgi:hypothetical protein
VLIVTGADSLINRFVLFCTNLPRKDVEADNKPTITTVKLYNLFYLLQSKKRGGSKLPPCAASETYKSELPIHFAAQVGAEKNGTNIM